LRRPKAGENGGKPPLQDIIGLGGSVKAKSHVAAHKMADFCQGGSCALVLYLVCARMLSIWRPPTLCPHGWPARYGVRFGWWGMTRGGGWGSPPPLYEVKKKKSVTYMQHLHGAIYESSHVKGGGGSRESKGGSVVV